MIILNFSGYLCGIDTPSRSVVLAVSVITLGTAATCTFTPQFSFAGDTKYSNI